MLKEQREALEPIDRALDEASRSAEVNRATRGTLHEVEVRKDALK